MSPAIRALSKSGGALSWPRHWPALSRGAGLVTILAALVATAPVSAFDLESDDPIRVSADNARLDDSAGTAVYSGAVVVQQGATELTAERVVLYRDGGGVSRIEASGGPARYSQTAAAGEARIDARAEVITYTADEARLIFEGKAVIEQADNVFRGDIIRYDTARRVVTAEGRPQEDDSRGRVEMVIQPRQAAPSQSTDRSEGSTSDGSTQSQ